MCVFVNFVNIYIYNISIISRKQLTMDVLISETCWGWNNEIKKQVTSSWSNFIQKFYCFIGFISKWTPRTQQFDREDHDSSLEAWSLCIRLHCIICKLSSKFTFLFWFLTGVNWFCLVCCVKVSTVQLTGFLLSCKLLFLVNKHTI
jgi:hypothetical protein